MANGKITQVIGTVVDVEFSPDDMPSIYNALETEIAGEQAGARSRAARGQ